MAEMHAMLWLRVTDRRLTHPGCDLYVLFTFEHPDFAEEVWKLPEGTIHGKLNCHWVTTNNIVQAEPNVSFNPRS